METNYELVIEATLTTQQVPVAIRGLPEPFRVSQAYPSERRTGKLCYCSELHLPEPDRSIITALFNDAGKSWVPLWSIGINTFRPEVQILFARLRSEGFDYVVFLPSLQTYSDFTAFPEGEPLNCEEKTRICERLMQQEQSYD
jgi:hypothetical protein